MLTRVKATIVVFIIRLLRFTWRLKIEGEHPVSTSNKSVVFCFWHGLQAALLKYPHHKKITVLTSLSKDGTLQSYIMGYLGYEVCRGSSSKGGAAGLKNLVKKMGDGYDAAISVDGPKGPFHKAKPGAIQLAKLSNALIVPIFSVAHNPWVFNKAWDKFQLPKPFSKITIIVSPPIDPQNLTPEQLTSKINNLAPQ